MLKQPFKTYNGGKSGNGTYQQIINLIPQCSLFIDAMVGNGGIVAKLNLPAITVINDYDSGVISSFSLPGVRDKNIYVVPSAAVKDGSAYGGHGKKIILENLHVQDLIDKYDYDGSVKSSTFFYFDPPYLKSTRKNKQNLYRYEWDEKDHKKFLSRVLTVKSNCMISHYPCELYDKELKEWNTHKFLSNTRNGQALECVYMNYKKPALLQDFSYVGSDFIERQRIKRKVQRWLKKLELLPATEATAIIAAVIDKHGYTAGELIKRK